MFDWGHFEWPVVHNGHFISHLGLLRLTAILLQRTMLRAADASLAGFTLQSAYCACITL